LVGLLSHDNADIALDIIELIHELTDEDVGEDAEGEDEGEEDPEQREAALKNLIGALVRPLLSLADIYPTDAPIAGPLCSGAAC
jgi:hypothetical protein